MDSIYLLSNLYGNLLDIWEWWVEPEEDLIGNLIINDIDHKWVGQGGWGSTPVKVIPTPWFFTCPPQDLLQTPYLRELLLRRGKLRPKCGECLGMESDQQSQNCQIKSSQQSMSSILTCSNDRQAGTREDVRIVALAWLVSLQRNKEIDFHRIYWQRISFQLTKIANGNFSHLAKALEVWEGRTWGKQSPTIGVGVRLAMIYLRIVDF